MATVNWSLQIKRDTAANWTSNDPTLLAGQLGYETDTGKLKIGSGVAWSATSYFYGGAGTLAQTLALGNTTGGQKIVVDAADAIDYNPATANEIAYFNAGKTLASLPTATYPSLTELSYVKGVTSAIQTQINAKGDALTTNPLSQFAATTSAQLAGVISDETGSGALVFGTSPTFTTDITTPLIIGGTAAGSYISYKSTTGIGASSDPAHIFTGGTNGATEIMRLLNGGKVGIGTNPTGGAYLQVNSGVTDEVATFTSSDSIAYITLTDSTGTGYLGTGSTGRVFIGSIASVSSSNLIIMGGGNGLGYGVTFPAISGLHIIKTTEQLRLGYDASNYLSSTVGSTGSLTFSLTGTTPEFYINNTGGVVIGNKAALVTTATEGFLYIPSCAGIPTGVPTAKTGKIPVVCDSTNNKMYIYSGGAWVALN